MSTQHTPGPWYAVKAIHSNDTTGVFSEEKKLIYMTRDAADARLIAAAPDMLNALMQVRFCLPPVQAEIVFAAIAKATGEIT